MPQKRAGVLPPDRIPVRLFGVPHAFAAVLSMSTTRREDVSASSVQAIRSKMEVLLSIGRTCTISQTLPYPMRGSEQHRIGIDLQHVNARLKETGQPRSCCAPLPIANRDRGLCCVGALRNVHAREGMTIRNIQVFVGSQQAPPVYLPAGFHSYQQGKLISFAALLPACSGDDWLAQEPLLAGEISWTSVCHRVIIKRRNSLEEH